MSFIGNDVICNEIQKSHAEIGDLLEIKCKNIKYNGILMPRYNYRDKKFITIKLKSGYNIGIDIKNITSIKIQKKYTNRSKNIKNKVVVSKLPKILFLTTGGTIASKIDYMTGGVTPILNSEEINEAIPELANIANINSKKIFLEPSENMLPNHWKKIAIEIDKYRDSDYMGIIISHGTDTMHYTSAYLSFALAGFHIPIVLVGSQRSLDRPSSDAALNLIFAIKFIINTDKSGVFVAMHHNENDEVIACHIGTKVRKCHTSKRNAFRTIGEEKPAFLIDKKSIIEHNYKFVQNKYNPRFNLDSRVALIKYYPGYNTKLIDYMVNSNYKAIIFEGTGMGHVGKTLYNSIKRANKSGIFLGMTSQCIDGMIQMMVYESGRKLLELGVIPLSKMIPEVAVVKAMWALGNSNDINEMKKLMLENISLEF